jgi:RHS repeat-associated protein
MKNRLFLPTSKIRLSIFQFLKLGLLLTLLGSGFVFFANIGATESENKIAAGSAQNPNSPPNLLPDNYNVHGNFDSIDVGQVSGVLFNDTDPDVGDAVRTSGMTASNSLGTASIAYEHGRTFFTANYGQTGSVTYPYTACDNHGACSSSTVTFNVINQPPLAIDDNYVVVRGANSFETNPVQFPPPHGVFANDIDPENDYPFTTGEVTYEIPNSMNPHSRVKIYSNGKASYEKLNPSFSGGVTVPYTVCDRLGGCSQAFVTFHVLAGGNEDNAGIDCASVGQPVNVTNGNMWLQQTDYQLPSIGQPIDVTRTYNSIQQSSGIFGFGWMTQYEQFIAPVDDRLVRVYLSDGRAIFFGRNNTTSAFAPVDGKDFRAGLVKNTDGSYTLTHKDGRAWQFNANGRLVSLKDRNNNQTTLTYNVNGQLTAIADAFGGTLSLTPNANGTIHHISDSIGTIATYEYFPDTTILRTVTYSSGAKYKFSYDTTTVAGKIFLATVKDGLDNILETHLYDAQGRAYTSQRQGDVNKYTLDYSQSHYTTVTDALGRVTKYYFDKSRQRNVITKTEGVCGCGGSGSEVTNYEYDAQLNLTKKTDSIDRQQIYSYDNNGNPLTINEKIGTTDLGTETYTYNSFGQVLTRTDKMGGVWTNTYDANGNLKTSKDPLNNVTTIEYPAVNNKGLPDSVKDARLNITKFKWFSTSGALQEVEDPYQKKTTYTYDARRRIKTITNALNHVTTYNYFDDTQRKIEMIYPNGDKITYKYDARKLLESVTDERGKITNYEFDATYRLKKIIDPLAHANEFDYDLMSNLKWKKDALGNQTDYKYDDFNRLKEIEYPPAAVGATRLKETFEYDTVGRIKRHYDTANRLTEYAYNDAARISTMTNALLEPVQVKYNARGQTIEFKDAKNQIYTFTYDALNRVLTQSRAGALMTYEYDEVGNRKKRTDYAGRETSYEYDNLNRLKKVNYLQSNDGVAVLTPIHTASYTYDEISRLKTATNENGTVSFNYDNRSRLENTTDVFGHTVAYEYELTPTVNQKRLKFDGAMYAVYNYDDANRPANIVNSADSTTISFGYDNADRLISRNYPNSVQTTYDYDGMSRLKQLKDATPSATLFDRQYVYNNASQVSQIIEPTQTRSFGYDLIDRLTSATNPGGTNESYGFDQVGNRTTSHRSASYGYQAGQFNRLTSTATTNYNYDVNGNMTTKAEGSNFWRYSWDYENRLASASTRKQTISYRYDALGRRVRRYVVGGKENTKFIYDGADVLVDDNQGVLTKYLNGAGVDNKLRMQTGSDVKYFLTDHLGSTNGLTDSSGALTNSNTYDSFGNASNANFPTRYQYTGREFDSATGLHYYRARFYDANLGRFISEDPIGFVGGDINLYAYVGNNSLNLVDPFGYAGQDRVYPIDLGSGWRGALDTTNNAGEGFEIHVVDPTGVERGIVNGRNGWIAKHGHSPFPPENIPRTTLNRINGLNLEQLRGRGLVPAIGEMNVNPFKGGGYLFEGRTLYGTMGGTVNILAFVHGLTYDYERYKRAVDCGRTYGEQMKHETRDAEYQITPLGVFPNPFYAPIS